ncbi:MAG: M3 family metallopeptidase [Bacteroidetes bacterium]|nr:M3 family metallopeptidase [Bacteroidota bacterium]
MKKHLLSILIMTIFVGTTKLSAQKESIASNPLLTKWDTPYETPPFNKIKPEHYLPAFKYAILVAKEEINVIKKNKNAATFENTIEAIEHSGMLLSRVSNVFFNLLEANSTEELQKIAYDVMPLVTEYGNDVSLDPILFERVNAVYKQKEALKLNTEQQMLLEKSYRGFVRNGANLDETQKKEYREISKELSDISLKYKDNLLKETNAFLLEITDKADLAGLPESAIAMGAITAKEKGKQGWAFDLSGPSIGAFMKYSERRDLRKQMSFAYASRCFKGNENDNSKIVLRFAELRLKMANLLGYKTYADYVLEERMAKSAAKVTSFLEELETASMPAAKEEVKEMQEFAAKNGLEESLQRWDWAFYSEKMKNEKFKIDDEMMKPYFELEKVKLGIFKLANTLYGLNFKANTKIPIYQQDVKTYEVTDEKGKFLAILYLDFFPRETKSNGAWMTSLHEQYKMNGIDHRPLIQVVCNFTKPTDDKPSLLTFDEVTTFLHEFGHALHGMLSNSTYGSLSGTSVYRDFVELPSQIMENFAVEKQFLDMFARHYKTNELIPADLIKRINDYNNFQAGYSSMRQITYAMSDMAWHSITQPINISVKEFERKSIESSELLPYIEGTNISTSFSHIFDGGYAAGYYSYKWAEVLDADAFSVFKKNGIFNKATADSFRKNILSRGGTEHPMTLYIRFRGQEPTNDALLIRSGLKK